MVKKKIVVIEVWTYMGRMHFSLLNMLMHSNKGITISKFIMKKKKKWNKKDNKSKCLFFNINKNGRNRLYCTPDVWIS